jgi:CHAT domain
MKDLDAANRLYQAGERQAAAETALGAAEDNLARGFRAQAFDCFGAAGKFFQLAGRPNESLTAFERAFSLFERDLVYQPRATHVIRKLASWPELYTRAALAALDVNQPLRAVSLAETGRTRAIAHRIGLDGARPPLSAPVDLWERYVRSWQRAIAIAANELVDEDGWMTRADTRAIDAELRTLRSELRNAGVEAEELAPVSRPVTAEDACARLAQPGLAPTAVLFTIRLDDTVLRVVMLSANGAKELPMRASDQARALRACDRYMGALRARSGRITGVIGPLIAELLEEAGPPLAPLFSQAFASVPAPGPPDTKPRLVWIPHGSLSGLPIQACPCAGGQVVDRAAVVVAPSVTLAMSALQPDDETGGVVELAALSGRYHAPEPPTDGGGAILAVLAGRRVEDVTPTSSDQFEELVRGCALVHLTCHGVYDWSDPLRSYLKLGERCDLSVEYLLGCGALAPKSLVLLGACDSGTIAQSDINEPIGVPMALQSAGAHSVVGAAWPVARVAAIGTCLQFAKELAAGAASPEALRRAAAWVRGASVKEFHRELAAIGHPAAEELAALSAENSNARLCEPPDLWAAYVHWGGGWRLKQAQ